MAERRPLIQVNSLCQDDFEDEDDDQDNDADDDDGEKENHEDNDDVNHNEDEVDDCDDDHNEDGRMTPKYSAKTRGMIMTVMLRQQQKTLKTCWTERSRAKEAISLVTPSYTHSHFVLDENMEEKNNPGKYSEEYEQQTREDLWRFAKTMIGLSLWFIFLLSNREQEARQRREEMLMQKQDAKQMQVDHDDDWMTIVIAMAR